MVEESERIRDIVRNRGWQQGDDWNQLVVEGEVVVAELDGKDHYGDIADHDN